MTELLIESKMKELPENKRKIIREEEMRKRRLELKEAKENVWKRWRGKSEKVREGGDDTDNGENMIEKIELAIERDREEKEENSKKKEKEKEEKREVAKEKEKQKVERKEKKKKLEEKWEMLRWITTYKDGNQVEWEDDSLEAEMTEVEARLAVKPAKSGPIIKTEICSEG